MRELRSVAGQTGVRARARTPVVLKGFLDAVPAELERAAAVDGATTTQTFGIVVLPVSLPPGE